MVDERIELSFDDLVGMGLDEYAITLTCVSNEVGGQLLGQRDLARRARARRAAAGRTALGCRHGALPQRRRVHRGHPARVAHRRRTGRDPRGRHERRAAAARARVPGSHGRARPVRLRVGDEVADRAQGDDVRRRRGVLDAARATARRRRSSSRRASIHRGPARPSRPDARRSPASPGRRRSASSASRSASTTADGRPPRCRAPINDDTWVQWFVDWDATPGSHYVAVRAVNKNGELQIEERAPIAPDGSTGWQRTLIQVT